MGFFSKVRETFLDFLFPKSARVVELEHLSSGELLRVLPAAPSLDDKRVIALFDYKDTLVKELVWQVKYAGNKKVAEKLGEILYDTIEHELAEMRLFENFDQPLLIPMPVSDKRRRERGWNQAELLAEALLKCDHGKLLKYLPRQLVKHFHTESQTKTASKSERQENLRGSMKVMHPPSVTGRNVIVIDDVTTTGSTFREARRALTDAGAKKIIFIAVAH